MQWTCAGSRGKKWKACDSTDEVERSSWSWNQVKQKTYFDDNLDAVGEKLLIQNKKILLRSEWNGDWGDESQIWSEIPSRTKKRLLSKENDGEFYVSFYKDFLRYFLDIDIIHLNPIRLELNEDRIGRQGSSLLPSSRETGGVEWQEQQRKLMVSRIIIGTLSFRSPSQIAGTGMPPVQLSSLCHKDSKETKRSQILDSPSSRTARKSHWTQNSSRTPLT